ncbi:hypothetical protein DCAR_0520091 [Daucus carota subsp. sativus]|uniref:Replication protein A OB domain-containing protein n=1 Tax=Daucus carota subsp. sativus TaxID=79200 RepID=A0AAF0X5D1_DAUCS|nr:hypothetical protein DCAR_0520091 [Daucus carota subsp. sativus]
MDAMNNKIHAFIPGQNVDKFEEKIIVPNLFIVSDFEVQAYKADDKFRCLHNTKQLIFDGETKMKDIEDDNSIAKEEVFDFYDHADLKNIADKNLHLTDIVGIIQDYDKLHPLKNRFGIDQVQMNFSITDGSSNVKVTFWDRMAEILNDEMAKETETPVIIIITSCKVGLWNGAVQLSNTAASKFYLNSSDPSVRELRKILKKPGTVLRTIGKPKRKIPELHSIDSIHTLGKEYIETEVITHVKFVAVDESVPWYRNVCTTCWNEVHINNDQFLCSLCNRIIPHADKKFQLAVMACDNSGELQILLKDRQVRTIIRKRVFDIDQPTTTFPQILKDLLNQNYTVKILISDVNVLKDVKLYLATNICKGFHDLAVHESETKQADHAQGGRIQAYIPRQIRHQFEDHIIEGETYDVNNFVVRRYSDMQFGRCFASDIYIQLNHMTEVLLTGDVDYIPPHVFQFTDLSTLMEAASENKFLIDVVGILEHHDPISTFRNRYNQQKSCFRFTINDMHTSAEVLFYDEMAEEFDQAIHDAVQHPIIVIISSCQAQFFRDAPKLSNLPPTRFFINPNHGAVEDLRDALRLVT